MSAPRATKTRASRHQSSLAERVAWSMLLAVAGALPLVTSSVPALGTRAAALTNDPYNAPKFFVLAIFVALATVAWLVDTGLHRRQIRSSPAFVPLALFVTCCVLSTALAPEPLSSLLGASGLFTGTVTWLLGAWTCFLLVQYVSSVRRMKQLSWAVVTGCAVVGLVAVLQALGVDPLSTPFTPDKEWVVRQGISTVGNPDYTALLLVIPTVVATALAMAATTKRSRWTAATCAAILALAAFITLTRAAWVGLAVGVVVLPLLTARDAATARRRLSIIAGVSVVLLLVGTFIATPEMVAMRFTRLVKGLDYFSSGRLSLWADTARIIAQHPLTGTGADRLAVGAYPIQKNLVFEGGSRLILQDPHSLPLLVAGVFGVPALLALAGVLGLAVKDAWRRARPNQATQSAPPVVYIGWLAGFVGFLTASILSVWTITAVVALFVGLGVLVAPGARPNTKAPRTTLIATALLGLALVAVSLFGSIRSIASDRQIALSLVNDPETHLQAAIDLTPWDVRTRLTYYGRKIDAYRQYLTGDDAADARAATEEIDVRLRLEIMDYPQELLFPRMRIFLYAGSKGHPGYQPDRHLQAAQQALLAFPGDTEFTAMREELTAGD